MGCDIRRTYEPRYGRRLSDDEVSEIERSLRAFAEGILQIGRRLYSRANKAPGNGP